MTANAEKVASNKTCKKKRGKKNLALATAHTDKSRRRRIETQARREARKRVKKSLWAARNGVVLESVDTKDLRALVRKHRAAH